MNDVDYQPLLRYLRERKLRIQRQVEIIEGILALVLTILICGVVVWFLT
jgi:hypothetical protein